MATAGLRVTSEYGTTQVTNTTAAFGLSAYNSVTLTAGNEARMKPYVTATVNGGGINPFIAIRTPSNKRVTLERTSGTNFILTCQSSDPVTIDYWIWDAASVALSDPSLSGMGMRVYTEFGNIKTFDAAMYSMNVVDIISVPTPGYNGGANSPNSYQTTTTISVPSGRVYAVIPTSLCVLQTNFDTGAYTNDPNSQSETVPDGGGIQPGDTYRRQKLEDYLTTIRSVSANEIEVGITLTGTFEGWYPIGNEPSFSANGASNFVVVDVTEYPSSNSGGLPIPPDPIPAPIDFPNISDVSNNPSIGINGGSRTWSSFNQEINVLVSLSGVSGTAENSALYCVVNGTIRNIIPINEGAYFNVLVNSSDIMYFYMECSTPSGMREKAFTATVINTSSGNAVLDTFTGYMKVDADNNHNVLDYTPDYLANFPVMVLESNEPDYSAWSSSGYGVFQVTGINQPITVRFERYDYSSPSGMDALYLDCFTKAPGEGWLHRGYISAHVAGNQFLDVANVVNGTEVAFNPHAITSYGRKTATVSLALWAISPGRQDLFMHTTGNSFTVDADNNYFPADPYIDALSIPTLSVVSNEYISNTSVSYFQITGINQAISLKFTRNSLTGNLFGRALLVGVADVGAGSGGPWTYYRVGAGAQAMLQIDNVLNGRWFSVFGELQTDSGVRTGAWQNYITNVTTGQEVASFRIEGTVDADNNYNIPDYTIDSLSPSDLSINTTDYYAGTNMVRTISGINQTVTIRATVSNVSGNISAGGLYLQKNGVNQGSGLLWTSGPDYRETTFVNGDQFALFIDAQTSSGVKSGQFYTILTNITTGEGLGGFWTYCNVDTDNNYNTADYVPDGFSLPTLTVNTNENYAAGSTGQDIRVLSGFNQQITLRLDMVGVSGSVTGGYVRLVRYTPSLGWIEAGLINLAVGGSCSAVFLPGDYVYTDLVSVYTDAGRKDMNFTLQLYNETGGNYIITQHAVNIIVDADNNYYDRDVNALGLGAMTYSAENPQGYGSQQQAFTISGINAPVSLQVHITNVSSGVADGYFYILNGGGGIIDQHHYNSGDKAMNAFTAYNGDQFTFYTDAVSIQARSCQFLVTFYNLSTGATLAQFWVNGTVKTSGDSGGGPE